MRIAYCDIETNGLVFECDTVHCATIYDPTDKEWILFAPREFINNITESMLVSIKKKANRSTGSLVRLCPVEQLPVEMQRFDKYVMHNGVKFDLPMINKVFNCSLPVTKVIDTLILSTISRPDRLGGHSLKSWGERLNEYKGEAPDDWSAFTYEMLIYNIQDVHVTIKTHEYVLDEIRSEYDKRIGVKWKSAIELEHDCAAIIYDAEILGVPFDYNFATGVLEEIDERLQIIDDELDKILTNRIEYFTPLVCSDEYDEYMTKQMIKSKYPESIIEGYRIDRTAFIGRRAKPTFAVFTNKGGHSANTMKYWGDDYYMVSGPHTKLSFVKTDPDSVNQMKEFLMGQGWQPTSFTDKGSPQITEDSLLPLAKDNAAIGLITEKYQLGHRRSLLLSRDETKTDKGLLNNIRPDGRITPWNNTYAGVTGRSRHSGIVNIPNIDSVYGPQFRKMFTSGNTVNEDEWFFETYKRNKDWSIKRDTDGNPLKIRVSSFKDAMVGCDASGLELRLLAHLLNDEVFINEVINGDVHTTFWKLIDNYISSRGKGKGVTYGFLYGAGDAKIGTAADIGRDSITTDIILSNGWQQVDEDAFITKSMLQRELAPLNFYMAQSSIIGKEIREAYLNGIPNLNDLVKELKDHTKKHKFLIGLDGRRLTSRSPHSSLNLKIQSTAAIVMKRALKIANSKFRSKGWKFGIIIFMHDEFQAIVKPKQIEFAMSAMSESIIEAGEYYDLNCPLDAVAKVGQNWLHTH